MPTSIKKRSVVVAGHRTSVSLERAFWDALRTIAARRDTTINQLVSEIDAARAGNLSSAIRVFVLKAVMERVPGQQSSAAGHAILASRIDSGAPREAGPGAPNR